MAHGRFSDLLTRDPAPKRFRAGTHRLMPPAETLGRALPFMPAMGITRIGNVTGLDRIGLPVVMVCRPNSRSLSVAQGKGLDLLAAKASGLMESIEGYHAEHIARPLLHESYQALVRQHRLVDVDKLPRTADSAFDPETPLYWIEGYDILQDEPAWVPYELVHLDYRVHSLRGARSFIPSSNGLASGNHLLEAVSHGICEVVEHDAEVLWSLGGTDSRGRTRIDLSTIHDPTHRWVLDRCAQADVAVYVWEITSDIGIPAFVCVMVDESGRGSGRCGAVSGMGCHPARQLALSRALTEAAQSRLTMISGSRDDKHPHVYEETTRPESLERVRRLVEVSGPLRGDRKSVV